MDCLLEGILMSQEEWSKPKKALGQNFLTDRRILDTIGEAVAATPADLIIEVGPGRGALTEVLLAKDAKVLAIELDTSLVPVLREKFAGKNFSLLEGDVLEVDFLQLVGERRDAKFAANLPYYISTAVLQKLCRTAGLFKKIVVMLQLEVAERITAPAGSSERGYLTVLIERVFNVESVCKVPPGSFMPQPKVWSAVVMLNPRVDLASSGAQSFSIFTEFASAAFSQKRKTLANNLKNWGGMKGGDVGALLARAGIEPLARAESLDREAWLRLEHEFRTQGLTQD